MDPQLRIFTFKEGLLSPLGHDLQLGLRRFELHLADGQLEGRFELDSLYCEGAVTKTGLDCKMLSSKDHGKILAAAREVLRVADFPEARLEASVQPDGNVTGTLLLFGRRCALPTLVVNNLEGTLITEATLVPSRWGIRPYRALAGALRVEDRIRVEVALPQPDAELGTATHSWSLKY